MSTNAEQMKAGSNREWNWHPDLPVAVTPLFSWPPRPIATLRWFLTNWLPVTEFSIYALMAWAIWAWVLPDLESMQSLEWGWILWIWAINFFLMAFVAQGLHVWLYGWKRQGEEFKYDRRGMANNNRIFLFNSQYWDNVTYTLGSGITVLTFYSTIIWMAYANGWAPMISFSDNPVWFILLFPLLPVIQSFHFYWLHRGLHIPWMYKHVHSVHHRSVSIAPWSGLSMHPIEHIGYLGLLLIFLVLPSHPVHFLFLSYWISLATATSHAGFGNLVLGDKAHLRIGSFHHQLHHRYFECNYGNPEMPWDNWFGSYHDGSPETTEAVRARKKQMHS